MSRMVSVRLDEEIFKKVEEVRNAERYPTQSAFIREAIRRMVREERRSKVRDEVRRLATDEREMERGRIIANAHLDDLVDRWQRADRGEL